MEVAFMESVSEEMLDVIKAGAWNNTQEPGIDLDVHAMEEAVLYGLVALFRVGDVVYCLSRQTAYIGRVDIFVKPGVTIHDCVRACRQFLDWVVDNTQYQRLEARSPQRFIYVLGRRCGARLDAIIPYSYSENGVMCPEYLMGWTRSKSWHQ